MISARWMLSSRVTPTLLWLSRFGLILLTLFTAFTFLFLSGCRSKQQASSMTGERGAAPAPPDSIELLFTYGSEKERWINEVTDKFNREDHRAPGGKRIFVRALPMGSGELISEILDGTRQPHIISPASSAYIKLGNAQSQTKTGKELISSTDNLVISPVVIAMWKPMAEALGWGKKPIGWSDILSLATNQKGWSAYG